MIIRYLDPWGKVTISVLTGFCEDNNFLTIL